jgi:hypothetical protein
MYYLVKYLLDSLNDDLSDLIFSIYVKAIYTRYQVKLDSRFSLTMNCLRYPYCISRTFRVHDIYCFICSTYTARTYTCRYILLCDGSVNNCSVIVCPCFHKMGFHYEWCLDKIGIYECLKNYSATYGYSLVKLKRALLLHDIS